jgi:hypothetical protein
MNSEFEQEFDPIKLENEKILWADKPKMLPFLCKSTLPFLISLPIGGFWIYANFNSEAENGGFIISHLWFFGALVLGQGLWMSLKKILAYKYTLYAFSNKRILIRSGFLSQEFKTIDLDKILDSEVKINFIERLTNVGTLKFHSGQVNVDSDDHETKFYDDWEGIQNPYEVYKQVQEIINKRK